MSVLHEAAASGSTSSQAQVNAPDLPSSTTEAGSSTTPNGDIAETITLQSAPKARANGSVSAFNLPSFSPSTAEILKRVSANSLAAASSGTPGWEAAREQVLKSMVTSDKFPTPPPQGGAKRGRGGKAGSPLSNGHGGDVTPSTVNMQSEQVTPSTGSSRGRGRGRGVGRGRGRGGSRGGKRKLSEDVIKAEDSDSDDSETFVSLATMTKSGRAVTKPTSFTPAVPSPASGVKRKRPINRKNPELTVCNVCLRPHSPLTNMIVFCDGCNTPYHRYCHHPPIEQEVVDVPEKEWFCSECRVQKPQPQPDAPVETFVSGDGISDDQKRAYLSTLPQTTLISLLLRASALHPSTPIFAPSARPKSLPRPAPPTDQEATNSTPQTQSQPSTTSPSISMPPPPAPPNGPTSTTNPATNNHNNNNNSNQSQQQRKQQKQQQQPKPNEDQDSFSPQRPPDEDEDEEMAGYEPAAHYPKPGHGLAATLPPESEDLQWLVDDNYEVYSHLYQSDAAAANEGLLGASSDGGR